MHKVDLFRQALDKSKGLGKVWLAGHNRTGTTLMYNLLRHHKAILKIPYDTHFFEDIYPNIGQFTTKQVLKLFEASSDFSRLKNDLDLYNPTDKAAYLDLSDQIGKTIQTRDHAELINLIFATTYYAQERDVHDSAQIVLEKSNENIFFRNQIQHLFPNSKWLLMVRNPVHVLNSQLKQGSATKQRSYAILHSIKSWYKAALTLEKELPERVRFIPYESLVSASIHTLEDTFRFLGIDIPESETLERYIQNAGFTYQMGNAQDRGSAVDAKSLSPKLDLPDDVIRLAEHELGFIYKRFEYPTDTNGRGSIQYKVYEIMKKIKK